MNESLRLARPPTLTQMAVDRLRSAIMSGRFQPGQRLVELELSESFGVSRAPLREAFRILAGEGLVDVRQNRGCIVANPSIEDLEQMVVFRATIEGTAARLVTARRDLAALDRLALNHQAMTSARKSRDDLTFLEAYWSFHRSLVALSGNGLLMQSWNTIGAMLRLFMSKSSSHFEDRREILNTIEGFLICFRSGDVDQAERVVRGMIIWMGFLLLDSRLPADVASCVTHVVGPGAAIVPIAPADLAAQRRVPPSAPAPTVPDRPKRGQQRAIKRAL